MNLREAARIVIKNVVKKKKNVTFAICISTAIDSAAKVAESGKAELYSHSQLRLRYYL